VDEQLEFLKEIASRLHAARIPYMLTGSVALSVYAKPRMTRDVDVVVELQFKDVDQIVKLFEKDCYVNRDAVQRAAGEQSMFSIIHQEWVIKADFIVRKEEPYRRAEFERRREIDIGGLPIAVIALEELTDGQGKTPESTVEWKEPPDGVEDFYESLLLRLPAAERLEMCCRMFQTAKTLALAGILDKLGENADPRQVKKALLLRMYGDEIPERQLREILANIENDEAAD
jgi:hypothetical protein